MLNQEFYTNGNIFFHFILFLALVPFFSTESSVSNFCVLFLFLVFFFFFNFLRLNKVIFSWFLLSSLLLSTTIASNRVRHEIHRWISRWKKFVNTPGKLCNSPKLPPANARRNRIFFLEFLEDFLQHISALQRLLICSSLGSRSESCQTDERVEEQRAPVALPATHISFAVQWRFPNLNFLCSNKIYESKQKPKRIAHRITTKNK